MIYNCLKLIHLFAVIIFLGNVITGLYWMHMAVKTKEISIISYTINGLIKSDRLFTVPGVVIITIGGFLTTIYGQIPIIRTGWIFWSLVLFTISGIIFVWRLVPLQKEIKTLTQDQNNIENSNWVTFMKVYRDWEIWGFLALITPLVAMIMMTLKIPS